MDATEKHKYKSDFKKALDEFVQELEKYVMTDNGEWTIKGFIDTYKNIYTISSDTKIVSKILEIHLFPKILQFAKDNDFNIILTEHQNYYPDLTFVHKNNEKVKFAVDLKTTYRKKNGISSFTLGSHGSYFKERDKKKNIQFPYNEYLGHYCLGVVYTRADISDNLNETEVYQVDDLLEEIERNCKISERKITQISELKSITSVIKDFEFFAAEKWKIASDKQGSGNTANIGSSLSIEDLRKENGVFSQLGEEWFDEYWINFGTATMIRDGETIKIRNLKDFLEFKGRNDLVEKIVTKQKK